MRRAEDGDYDAWGVLLPTGKIREFGSRDKATTFRDRMEGQTIMTPEGTWQPMVGLTLIHRYIPAWEIYQPEETS